MASLERSPKRQRLSPPNDDGPYLTGATGRDSAYGSTNGSSVNGHMSTLIPGLSIAAASKSDIPMAHKSAQDPSTGDATRKQEDAKVGQSQHDSLDPAPSATENLPLLCQKPHPRSRPHPTQNLISLYGLSALAATVARRDPTTGAKINKLRKSYEGKVKKQDLPGRNKPTTKEGELMGFMEWPEEGWYDQRVYGRELEHALDPAKGRLWREDSDMPGQKGKVERAVTLAVGKLPREEDEKWRGILALDEPAPVKPPAKGGGTVQIPQANGLLKPGVPGTAVRTSAPASPLVRGGPDRPERQGKKRRYDDTSFEGYDGGWEEGGYMSTDSRGNKGKRRRELDHSGSTPQSAAPSDNHSHFGSSSGSKAVGVRSS